MDAAAQGIVLFGQLHSFCHFAKGLLFLSEIFGGRTILESLNPEVD